uniref:Uncharacterized protein n=1 Tax=Timema bartmani TaxID=61472 RepID=A0A7R9I2J4_9NEOP|nr:unnamed protein product [Timema bartmani]
MQAKPATLEMTGEGSRPCCVHAGWFAAGTPRGAHKGGVVVSGTCDAGTGMQMRRERRASKHWRHQNVSLTIRAVIHPLSRVAREWGLFIHWPVSRQLYQESHVVIAFNSSCGAMWSPHDVGTPVRRTAQLCGGRPTGQSCVSLVRHSFLCNICYCLRNSNKKTYTRNSNKKTYTRNSNKTKYTRNSNKNKYTRNSNKKKYTRNSNKKNIHKEH